jgi:hypothetical protein
MHKHLFASFTKYLACAALAAAFVAPLSAADEKKADAKADPNGNWTWTAPGRQGGEGRKMTLKLKAEGEKLTGAVTTPGRDGGDPRSTDISNGKVKGDEVSFDVVREFNGNQMKQSYTGKVAGDAIKGKINFKNRDGEDQSRDWEAKRDK